jgi:hypothetical protein
VPVIVAAAEPPLVTVPILRVLAGPVAPVAPVVPVAPVAPVGSVRFRVCEGAVPVIVAAAVPPLVTVPIDSEFVGPVAPVAPAAP